MTLNNYSILRTALLCGAVLLSSCTNKNDKQTEEPPTENTVSTTTLINHVAVINPELNFGASATYKWSIEKASSEVYALKNINDEKALFIASEAGEYKLKLTAAKDGKSYVRQITITVTASEKAQSPYIARVYDFLPAVGQFTNELPKYEAGYTKADMITKAEESLVGKKNGTVISLGGFGGYVIFGFDHTIANVNGRRDFRIMGNAFYAEMNPKPDAPKGGNCEPGIIMVAYDANQNGKPDDNEWYEIAGSEYNKATTLKNYELNYYRPQTENPVNAKQYIRWDDNQNNSGYKEKNSFHRQSYYPSWVSDNKITFRGTRLPNNAIDESGDGSYWVLYAYGYGYADNVPNGEDDSAIDISWAVNSKGEKVELPGVDFVKVSTGINQEAGAIGEVSTEITGAYDLHLSKENIATVK